MIQVRPFSDEQSRLLVNLRQRYEVWMAAEQELAAMPYDRSISMRSGTEAATARASGKWMRRGRRGFRNTTRGRTR